MLQSRTGVPLFYLHITKPEIGESLRRRALEKASK